MLDSPAWLEPDLCALEEWPEFARSLVQMIATGVAQRSTLVCGLTETARRKLERDVSAHLGGRKLPAGSLLMLSRESDLSLETLPDLLMERLDQTSGELGIYLVHDMAWAAARYSVDEVLAYLQRLAVLRRENPFQAVHIYPPSAWSPEATWRLMRGHRAIWTGESSSENFYYTPKPLPPPPAPFPFEDDLKRNLDHLRRQSRIRAELVGTVVQTEALMEERVRELQALNRLAQILAHSQDLDEILFEALSRVMDLLEMEAGGIYVRSEDGDTLTRRVHIPGDRLGDEALQAFHDSVATSLDIGRISWASDLRDSPQTAMPAGLNLRSYLVAPLKFSGGTVGLLEVVGSGAHAFSLQEIHMVDVIGGQIGVAVENARLYDRHVQSQGAAQRMRAQLQQAERLASVGELVSRIIQEVETPLAAALEAARNGKSRKALEKVISEGSRVERVLANLRLLVGEKRADRRSLDLNEVLRECVQRRRDAFARDGIELRLNLADNLPPVLGDASQLEQVFANLLDNAGRAVRGRGRQVGLSSAATSGEVTVVVEDDGPGIAPDDLSRVFEPFFTTGTAPEGAGLGLAICRALVQSHGGTVQAQSAPGKRTWFTVSLPAQKISNPSARETGKRRSASRKP